MVDRGTVHILKHGVSYCRMPGLPCDWPEGHSWLAFYDPLVPSRVNCPTCLAEHVASAAAGSRESS